jgi:hypothetical protein
MSTGKTGYPLDPQAIDALYGLEPVFEPGDADSLQSTDFVSIQCPYCGERFETVVDRPAGAFSYVEDCQVCCQPIELVGTVDEADGRVGIVANRAG